MIRLLVADDHPVVRRGLAQILAEEDDFDVAMEAETAAEVLAQVTGDGIDVVVLDLSMPGAKGVDLLRDVRQRRPEIPVLVLSIHPQEQYGIRCLKAGAAGYLEKSSAPEHLVEAIRTVADGQHYLSPALAERLIASSPDGELPHEALSNRELEVFLGLVSGKTVGDLGEELALSVKTVSTYRSRLLEKMGMRSRAELTRYALTHGLIS